MDNLTKILNYRDRLTDEYLDACVDESYTIKQVQELRNRLADLEEYIEAIQFGE